MVNIEIPRCDTNEGGASVTIEVTVTSEPHAQAERTQKQKEKTWLNAVGAQRKIQKRETMGFTQNTEMR